MKLYLSKTHSDEDGPISDEGKLGIVYSSKDDIKKLCDFFQEVQNYISKNDTCHMHFRDSFDDWDKDKHIDFEINIE